MRYMCNKHSRIKFFDSEEPICPDCGNTDIREVDITPGKIGSKYPYGFYTSKSGLKNDIYYTNRR